MPTELTPKSRRPRTPFGTLGEKNGKFYPSYMHRRKRYRSPSPFSNRGQARAWLSAQQAAIEAGEWSSTTPQEIAGKFVPEKNRAVEFEAFARKQIASRRKGDGTPLAQRTRVGYDSDIRNLAVFHGRDLRYITEGEVNAWWDNALDYGKLTTAAHAYTTFRSVMEAALAKRLIRTNPVYIKGAGSLRTGKKVRLPSDSEVDAILRGLPLRWRALFVCEAWGGLRYGEVTELRRSDVVFGQRITVDNKKLVPKATIHVERAVVWLKGQGALVKDPKSEAGARRVPLSTRASLVLDEYLKSESAPSSRDALLWTALSGPGHLRYSVYWRIWGDALEAAGVEYFNPHGLRHYAATLYAQAGATLKELQTLFGHSTAQAAMRYQHAAAERLEELADKVEGRAAEAIERQRMVDELLAEQAATAAKLTALGVSS